MPTPHAIKQSVLSEVALQLQEALLNERQTLATYLEERHAILLTHLLQHFDFDAMQRFPDVGPEVVFPDEPSDDEASVIESRRKNGSMQSCVLTRDVARRRLFARLGYLKDNDVVSAADIVSCMETVALETFNVVEIQQLLVALGGRKSARSLSGVSHCSQDPTKSTLPAATRFSAKMTRSSRSSRQDCITFSDLMEALLLTENEMLQLLGAANQQILIGVRDILLSSDANCMVAELLYLKVDDLTTPKTAFDPFDTFEPVVALLIILNGAVIGLDAKHSNNENLSLTIAEFAFTVIFTVELVWRASQYKSWSDYFFGYERHWNRLDCVIVFTGILEGVAIFFEDKARSLEASFAALRLLRLTRLVRVLKLIRWRFFAEIKLMVQGLLGGLRTLLWAVVLLFGCFYVMSVFLTVLVGQDERNDAFDIERQKHFSTLARTFFTTFRCSLIVDCASSSGTSLLLMISDRYGWLPPLCYCLFFCIVNIGLLNLIMAVYIENTLAQAKQNEERSRLARNRESLKVARRLKFLLVKFFRCAQEEAFADMTPRSDSLQTSAPGLESTEISREVFMLALHDAEVQAAMDELDIPAERAQLFDVLDADGSGQLKATELLDGLLKVRGEARRTDTAGTWLAIRAVQNQIRGIAHTLNQNHSDVLRRISRCDEGNQKSEGYQRERVTVSSLSTRTTRHSSQHSRGQQF